MSSLLAIKKLLLSIMTVMIQNIPNRFTSDLTQQQRRITLVPQMSTTSIIAIFGPIFIN